MRAPLRNAAIGVRAFAIAALDVVSPGVITSSRQSGRREEGPLA